MLTLRNKCSVATPGLGFFFFFLMVISFYLFFLNIFIGV